MAELDNVRNALRAWALTQGYEVTDRPYEVYKKYTPCPGTVPFDAQRQPGKETLLCAHLSAAELVAAKRDYRGRVLLLRDPQ